MVNIGLIWVVSSSLWINFYLTVATLVRYLSWEMIPICPTAGRTFSLFAFVRRESTHDRWHFLPGEGVLLHPPSNTPVTVRISHVYSLMVYTYVHRLSTKHVTNARASHCGILVT